MSKIIAFTWDNAKGEDYNGKSLIVGQFLPKADGAEYAVQTYGISLGIADTSKDFQLKRYGCHESGLTGDLVRVSKSQARDMLLKKLDEALDILFDETEMQTVEEKLNREKTPEELDEEEED